MSSPASQPVQPNHSRPWRTSLLSARSSVPPQMSSAAGRGAGLYRANCSACHGDSLAGTSLGPSLLDDRYQADQLSDDAIRLAIRTGVEPTTDEFGAMPGNAMLRDAQIDEIISFVRSQQPAATPTTP